MVIPEGTGTTSSYTLHSGHVWLVWTAGILLVSLAFTSSFMVKRYLVAHANMQNAILLSASSDFTPGEMAPAAPAVPARVDSEALRATIERDVRAEFEKAYTAITSELNSMFAVEAQIREIHGLPPREGGAVEGAAPMNVDGGKGGGPGASAAEAVQQQLRAMNPPTLIHGLSQPSADLIVEEIRLREASLSQLLASMKAKADRIARTPSIWPSRHPKRAISSRYGYRRHPILNKVRHHDGTDITAPYGSSVVSTAKGTVTFAGYENYYGNMVKIDHGFGVETWYAHLSRTSVKAGQEVARGDAIGKLGSTGMSTGPHIHYEVRVNGKTVDSGLYLGS